MSVAKIVYISNEFHRNDTKYAVPMELRANEMTASATDISLLAELKSLCQPKPSALEHWFLELGE